MSEERIKLIWDFRHPDAEQVASHHVKHLEEYIEAKNIEDSSASFELIAPGYGVAFILTSKKYMIQLRDDLKPHRGELA